MEKICILVSFFLLGISYLIPLHFNPWLTFLSEILVFSSCVFLFLAFFKEKIILPKILIPLFLLSFLPLFQYFFGQVYFFSHAIINTTYLITLFLIIVVVFNIVNKSE